MAEDSSRSSHRPRGRNAFRVVPGGAGDSSACLASTTESSDERLLRSPRLTICADTRRAVLDIESCVPGEEVTMAGSVTSVGNPREEHPALEIELSDTTGTNFRRLAGRRRIPGIDVGRRMVIHGRLNCVSEHLAQCSTRDTNCYRTE